MRSRSPVLMAVLALALAGCPAPSSVGGTGKPGGPTTRKSPTPAPTAPVVVATPTGTPALLATNPRTIAQTADVAMLTGKAKLISDSGGGVISNNTGSLISDSGGGLTGKAKLSLAQLGGLSEALLAQAVVTVHDAAGHQLVDGAGKPIMATTDAEGRYTLTATLPDNEAFVLKIELWQGGWLSAIVPADSLMGQAAEAVPLDLTTSTSLAARYVLDAFVKGDPAILAKLPAGEADRLVRDMEAARAKSPEKPSYQDADLKLLANRLRDADPTVAETLADIEVLLLGQANLGEGASATHIGLVDPRAIAREASGRLVIAEGSVGRLRAVGADGKVSTLADGVAGAIKKNYFGLGDMLTGPDGALWLTATTAHELWRVTGTTAAPVAVPAGLEPGALAFGADKTLYVGEATPDGRDRAPRVGKLVDGAFTPLGDTAAFGVAGVSGLAAAADGTLWASVRTASTANGKLWKLAPGGGWTVAVDGLSIRDDADVLAAPDGAVLYSEDIAGTVTRLAADGTRAVLAGKDAGLVRPSGLAFDADGSLLVTDTGTGRVWRRPAAGGALVLVAGLADGAQSGDAGALALNGPGGVGFDTQGRMVFTEGPSHVVRRYAGGAITTIAGGGGQGYGGDGGPATAALLNTPTGLTVAGDTVWFIDAGNQRLRKIDAAGTITTVVGADHDVRAKFESNPAPPAAKLRVKSSTGVAVGPDGQPSWITAADHQAARLRADGTVQLLTGRPDETKSSEVGALSSPLGIAWGPDGAAYVTDGANMRIVRVAMDGAAPVPTVFAGLGQETTIARGLAGQLTGAAPTPRLDATLVVPGGICFDKAGNLYVGELGTAQLGLMAAIQPDFLTLPSLGGAVPARIRKIAPDGQVTIVAGPGGRHFPDAAAADALVLPTGLAIDPAGRLVIVDTGANQIRFIPAGQF